LADQILIAARTEQSLAVVLDSIVAPVQDGHGDGDDLPLDVREIVVAVHDSFVEHEQGVEGAGDQGVHLENVVDLAFVGGAGVEGFEETGGFVGRDVIDPGFHGAGT
jgi:hypothetical protein